LEEFKSKVENNEPIPPGIFEKQGELMNSDGITIFNEHREVISQA
jgi:hypothetical protein